MQIAKAKNQRMNFFKWMSGSDIQSNVKFKSNEFKEPFAMIFNHSVSKDGYGVSRVMYITWALFEYFVSILTTGTFLAKLTTSIGISDSMTAVLSSITSLSGLFQLVSIFLAHKAPVKRWVIPMQLIAQLILAALYLIPSVGLNEYAGVIFFVIIVSANALKNIIAPVKTNWFLSLIDSRKRGMFASILHIVSVVGGTLFTLAASEVIDSFEEAGNLQAAFNIIAVTILVLIVLDIICLGISKEKHEATEKHESPFESISNLFKNPPFRRLLLIIAVQSVGSGICTNFLGTYQIKELGFTMEFISLTNIITNVVWVGGLMLFGRLAFKFSYQGMLRTSFVLTLISYFFVIISTPAVGMVTFTLYRCISLLASSASSVSQNNLIFELAPPEERTSALATMTIFTGTITFLSTLAVTPLVNYIQSTEIIMFGTQIYAQQILATASFVISIITTVLFFCSYKKLSNVNKEF